MDEIVRRLQTTLPPWHGEPATDVKTLEDVSLEIYEATFRYLFDHNVSGLKRRADAFCLRVDGRDPPQALLDRFAGDAPRVLPGSKFGYGKKYLRFNIANLRMQGTDSAVLEAGYHEGPLSGSNSTLHLLRESGQWIVIFERRNVISTLRQRGRSVPTLIDAHGNAAEREARSRRITSAGSPAIRR